MAWTDFSGWGDLYHTRYEEVSRNPDLGVYLHEQRPSVPEEATFFGQVMKQVLAGDGVASVAEEDGMVVGSCMVFRRGHHLEDRHLGELGVAVHPAWRGKGIGDALLRTTLERCRGVFEIVELKVLAINEPALRLYRKHGFEVHGRQPRSFKRGDRYLDDVLMWGSIEALPSSPPPL